MRLWPYSITVWTCAWDEGCSCEGQRQPTRFGDAPQLSSTHYRWRNEVILPLIADGMSAEEMIYGLLFQRRSLVVEEISLAALATDNPFSLCGTAGVLLKLYRLGAQ
jgi:hypothetical protein